MLIPVIILVTFFALKTKRIDLSPENGENRTRFICLGLLIIFIVGFPYAAVRKYPDIFSERARYGIFGSIGLGIFIIGIVGQFLNNKKRSILKSENFILCQIIICFVVINFGFYASWQGRWVKYQSISARLNQMVPLKKVSIYFLRDQISTILKPNYEYNDFTLILNKAWGGERLLGITPFFQRNRPESVVAREAIKIWHTKNYGEVI